MTDELVGRLAQVFGDRMRAHVATLPADRLPINATPEEARAFLEGLSEELHDELDAFERTAIAELEAARSSSGHIDVDAWLEAIRDAEGTG